MTHDAVEASDLETETHVWLARTDDVLDSQRHDQYHYYLDLLSKAERVRYERFHFDVHRNLYLVSHALVRTSLSRYADIAPKDWQFLEGEFGRPEILEPPSALPLRFNLSHTEGLAACVVCRDVDCGVDVERLNRVKDLEGVARRVLTATEREDLGGLEGDSLQGRFTDYWTLKEAYMKARGKGFQLPPHTFAIRLEDSDSNEARLDFSSDFDDRADEWQLAVYPITGGGAPGNEPDYRLGIALRTGVGGSRRIVVRETVPG